MLVCLWAQTKAAALLVSCVHLLGSGLTPSSPLVSSLLLHILSLLSLHNHYVLNFYIKFLYISIDTS